MLSKCIPVIFGCESTALSTDEIDFFQRSHPYGYILFKRNIEHPEQVIRLVDQLRTAAGWACPILIDQEGGRVARLRPPHWPEFRSMEALVANLPEKEAIAQVYANAKHIGETLIALGITVDCAPVCDLKIPGAHDIVGDRSFGSDPAMVATLALAMCRGLHDAGVMPIIKHIPGHGRAHVDSHEMLPVVTDALDVLEATDFNVFSRMNQQTCWAMTAHVVYTALDPLYPATLSKKVIGYIRDTIGFKGILVSDDLSMKALSGDLGVLAVDALHAGCDLALHCNGKMDEMQIITTALQNSDIPTKHAAL